MRSLNLFISRSYGGRHSPGQEKIFRWPLKISRYARNDTKRAGRMTKGAGEMTKGAGGTTVLD